MADLVVKIIDIPLANSINDSYQFLSLDRGENKTRLVDFANLKSYVSEPFLIETSFSYDQANSAYDQANSAYDQANSAYNLANDKPYGIIGYYPGNPAANTLIIAHIAKWGVYFPANLSNSKFIAFTSPSANANLNIIKNDVIIGNVTFLTENTTANFQCSEFNLSENDILKIKTEDTTDSVFADLSFTIAGTRI